MAHKTFWSDARCHGFFLYHSKTQPDLRTPVHVAAPTFLQSTHSTIQVRGPTCRGGWSFQYLAGSPGTPPPSLAPQPLCSPQKSDDAATPVLLWVSPARTTATPILILAPNLSNPTNSPAPDLQAQV